MRTKILLMLSLFISFNLSADRLEDYYISSLLGEKPKLGVMFNTLSSVTNYNDISGLNLIESELSLLYNTDYAYSMNDGSLWQGRGLSYEFQTGIEYIHPMFQLRFFPKIWGAQNTEFDLIETSESDGYGHYWNPLDSLQRYGDEYYYEFDLGQSDIRFHYKNYFTIGVSNENISLGSSKLNPLLLSNNAAGFLHLDYGTNGIIETPIGGFELRVLQGMLEESEFFDDDDTNDEGFINSLTVGYSPVFLKGFSLGINVLYLKPWANVTSWDFLSLFIQARNIFYGGRGLDVGLDPGQDDRDTMATVNADWFAPEIGLHIYGEWGRTDFGIDTRDLFRTPEHTQAFTLGFSKILYRTSLDFFNLKSEITSIEQGKTYLMNPGGSWYRHSWSGWIQGYTNKGQNLGAAIGPGSNSQYLGLDYHRGDIKVGGFIQRICYDNDYYYNIYIVQNNVHKYLENHENYNNYSVLNANRIELSVGLDAELEYGSFTYGCGFIYSRFLNRDYIPDNDVNNFNLSLTVKYDL